MTTSANASTGQLPGRLQRLADAAVAKALGQAKARNRYAVEPGLRIAMRDGVDLIGDHYAPLTASPLGTVLIRTPYGRGFPEAAMHGRTFAARGYHVLIQSVRGTFGSGGSFRAMAQETEDGHDTVAWLRAQPWFTGKLATLGGSYLGWVQWALLQDPPPELKTSIVYVGPHDFREAVFGTGSYTLGDFLGWAYQIAHQEDGGILRRFADGMTARRRLEPALNGLPLADAAAPTLDGRTPWYFEWLEHAEDEAFWDPYRANAALHRVDVPILLVSGWQDLFLLQTLEQYRVLHERGIDVALTVGPWTHFGVAAKGAGLNTRDALAWLDEHVAGTAPRSRPPVRAFRTGDNKWQALTGWPPAATTHTLRLTPDGRLTPAATPTTANGKPAAQPTEAIPAPTPAEPAENVEGSKADGQLGPDEQSAPDDQHAVDEQSAPDDQHAVDGQLGPEGRRVVDGPEGTVTFRYDPADPTPSVGGRVMTGEMGVCENRELEARPDVLTFTTGPLPAALDVAGAPVVELTISVDNPHADIFLRLCDVDEKGRSRNFSDRLQRLDPAVPAGQTQQLRLMLDHCFHRLAIGHRLRLQVSGGAFPRYARNLGTDGTLAEGSKLAPSAHTVHCAHSHLVLPLAHPVRTGGASTTP
jgi:putative CocE/NonD family hydrolase